MKTIVTWLLRLSAILGAWYGLLSVESVPEPFNQYPFNLAITYFPLLLLILFAIVSIMIVTYRVIIFPECPNAAKSLQIDIQRAHKFYADHGITIGSSSKKTQ